MTKRGRISLVDRRLRSATRDRLEVRTVTTHPLDPRGDETVSRIVGRRETEGVAGSEGAMEETIRFVARRAFAAFGRRGRMDGDDIAAIAGAYEDLVVACGLSDFVVREGWPRAKDRLTRTASTVSTSRLGAGGSAKVFYMVLTAEPCGAKMRCYPMPAEWRQHVVDRLHMRRDGRGDAHVEMARLAIDKRSLIEELCWAVAESGEDCTLPIPVADGIVRGLVETAERRPPIIESTVYARAGAAPLLYSGSIGAMSTLKSDRRALTWTGVTYLGPDEIDGRARDYAAAFQEAHAAVRAATAAAKAFAADEATAATVRAALATTVRGIAAALLKEARASGHGRSEGRWVERPPTLDPWDFEHPSFWAGIEEARAAQRPRLFALPPGPARPAEAARRAMYARVVAENGRG